MTRPAHTFDIATVMAMAAYPLDPGHSDLDNEQPMSVRVGDHFVRCDLGDIREAKSIAARARFDLVRAVRHMLKVNDECVDAVQRGVDPKSLGERFSDTLPAVRAALAVATGVTPSVADLTGVSGK